MSRSGSYFLFQTFIFQEKLKIFEESDFEDGSGEDSDDSDDLLDVEKKSLALDQDRLRIEAEQADDLKISLSERSEFVLPSGQQVEREKQLAPDLTIINQRIQVINPLPNRSSPGLQLV